MTDCLDPRILKQFRKLEESGYCDPSEPSYDYNCAGLAAGHTDQWWQASGGHPEGGYSMDQPYWYAVDKDDTLDEYKEQFRRLKFQICDDGTFNQEFEKIAIYATDEDRFKHVAIQVSEGWWKSKFGDWGDCTHALDALEGEDLGRVRVYMHRKKVGA